jgi:hypothetical protein
MIHSKYSLEGNHTVISMFRAQYAPDFFVAEYCCFAKHYTVPKAMHDSIVNNEM